MGLEKPKSVLAIEFISLLIIRVHKDKSAGPNGRDLAQAPSTYGLWGLTISNCYLDQHHFMVFHLMAVNAVVVAHQLHNAVYS